MSNRTYDLVVLLDADAPTDTRTKIVADAQALIAQAGEVKANKDWGTRQLPYLIDHHEEAAYHVFQFESDPQAINKLDRGLKLTEGVLRFRIFETEAGQTLPENPPLFKREERGYERPPREASATPTLDESPAPAAATAPAAPAAEAPAADAPAEAAPAEAAPAEAAEAPAEAAAETPAEPAAAPAAEPAATEPAAAEPAAAEPVANEPAVAEPAPEAPAEAEPVTEAPAEPAAEPDAEAPADASDA